MEAIIRVKVDDELLARRIEEANEALASEGSTLRHHSPEEYVLERLREVCTDELPVALWGWSTTLDLKLDVELT